MATASVSGLERHRRGERRRVVLVAGNARIVEDAGHRDSGSGHQGETMQRTGRAQEIRDGSDVASGRRVC